MMIAAEDLSRVAGGFWGPEWMGAVHAADRPAMAAIAGKKLAGVAVVAAGLYWGVPWVVDKYNELTHRGR